MPGSGPRPRIPEMLFQVFGQSLHPDWLAVRAHQRIIQDGWDADVRINANGHAIHWRYERLRVTEVLGPAQLGLPDGGNLFRSPLRQARTTSLQLGDGVEYHTSFEVERCDVQVFDHLCTEATLDARREGLFTSFASANRLETPAISLVRFESRSQGLSIHTFHSFPTERAILRTHSLFEARLALPAR